MKKSQINYKLESLIEGLEIIHELDNYKLFEFFYDDYIEIYHHKNTDTYAISICIANIKTISHHRNKDGVVRKLKSIKNIFIKKYIIENE